VILTVPKDATLYPTLGGQVCDFIEQNLVYGPGDMKGLPVVLDDDKRGLIYRMYEVYPKGHEVAGRRRFTRVGLSLVKGIAKTELAAMLAACELHPEGPVRCTGFTKRGEPIGGPVTDPYIPLVAFSEEQSDELAYAALKAIIEGSSLRDDFDIGLERILRRKGDGKAVSLSSNPDARDGARTTFCVFDETHRWTLPRHRRTHQVMLANLSKRRMANPWALEITTAPEPGAGSVAEATMDYARAVDAGKVVDSNLFYFHQQASDTHDLATVAGRRAAVIEASGAAAAWRDIDGIVSLWNDPTADKSYLERVYTNRLTQGDSQAFSSDVWKTLARPDYVVKPRAAIVLGFDGAQFHDSTALVGTEIETGYQWTVGLWERPTSLRAGDPWKVPAEEVDQRVRETFAMYQVARMYADPPYWETWVSSWVGLYGKERVHEWFTNRIRQMAFACRAFRNAIKEASLSHSEDPAVTRHIGNSRRDDRGGMRDDEGQALFVIKKDRPDSVYKIDAAMASILSWEARNDAIAAGEGKAKEYNVFFAGGR
jgi:phage terminase large subunit-like protein